MTKSNAHADLPQQPTVAVIGGRGAMGGMLAESFASAGCDTLIADVHTPLSNQDAAAKGDLVMIAVPIQETERVIRELAPLVRDDACLMDVTSLKEGPLDAMLTDSVCEVVGTHPMFGPGLSSLKDQLVILTPGRGQRWLEWIRLFYEAQGARTVQMDPASHDRAMAILQVLRHVSTMAFGSALADLDADVMETLRLSSPIYRLELMMAGRLFAQDPGLYADIGLRNPRSAEVVDALEGAVAHIAKIVRSGDRDGFVSEFHRVASHFGAYRTQALEESAGVIARVVDAAGGEQDQSGGS